MSKPPFFSAFCTTHTEERLLLAYVGWWCGLQHWLLRLDVVYWLLWLENYDGWHLRWWWLAVRHDRVRQLLRRLHGKKLLLKNRLGRRVGAELVLSEEESVA